MTKEEKLAKKKAKKEQKALRKEEKRQKHLMKKDKRMAKRISKKIRKEEKKQQKLSRKKAKYDSYSDKKKAKLEKRKIKKEAHRKLNAPPERTVLEEIGNAVTHGVGAIWAIVALVLMILRSDTGLKLLASLVYGISMFFMMLMSCLYHSFKKNSTVKRIWRRFDYTSIYLLIGGTFAPLFLVDWGNQLGIILFIVQWILIITGITMVCVFGPGRLKWLHFPLYFLIGWSGVMFIPGWIKTEINLFYWILGGGLTYTIGMIPFCKPKVKGAHFIWHFFVLAGAIVHWLGIFLVLYC